MGNGPRVIGFDLGDHPDQYVLLCRQNLVASGGRICRRRLDRSSIRSHLHHHGDCVSGGAIVAGIHRVEIPGGAFVCSGYLFSREHAPGDYLDRADRGSVYWAEPDGEQRVGEPTFRSSRSGGGAGGSDGDAVCLVLPLSGSGWKVWQDESELDGPVSGWRGCSGPEPERSCGEG